MPPFILEKSYVTHKKGKAILEGLIGRLILSYGLKMYIKDDNGEWVDFSDKVGASGKDALMSIGTVKHTSERAGGRGFYTTVNSIKVDNSDYFWDKQPPSSLKTIEGNTADFGASAYYQAGAWFRREIKLALRLVLEDGSIEEGTLGVFYIEGLETDNISGKASLKLIGMAKPLMERDASLVKDGKSWHINKSYKFLIRELLKQELADDSGDLPSDFRIPDLFEIETAGGTRTLSLFGRPPEYTDTDRDGEGNSWLRKSYVCRATEWGNANPLNGRCAYLGCDEFLYRYDPAKDLYTACTNGSDDWGNLGNDYYIRKLWWNPNDSKIWGIACTDTPYDNSSPPIQNWQGRNTTAKLFSYNDTDGFAIENSHFQMLMSWFCYRDGRFDGVPSWEYTSVGRCAGGIDCRSGENVVVPFKQKILAYKDPNVTTTPGQTGFRFMVRTSLYDQVAGQDEYDNEEVADDMRKFECNRGFTFGRNKFDPGESIDLPFRVRFSLGQTGLMLFSEHTDSSGTFFYGWWDETGEDYNVRKIDLSSPASTSAIADLTNLDWQPISGCASSRLDIVYIGAVKWVELGTATDSETYVYTSTDGTNFSKLWDSTVDVAAYKYYTPIEMSCAQIDVLDYPWIEMLDRDTNKYVLCKLDTAAIVQTCKHDKQYKGLVLGSSGDASGGENRLYFMEQGAGRILLMTTALAKAEILDDGNPVEDSELHITSNLALDSNTRSGEDSDILYGITAPFPPTETQYYTPTGKYYLFKFDSYYSNRVELADFSDLKVWEVLEKLMEITQYNFGIMPDGNFFCIKRTLPASADYELANETREGRIYKIRKSLGYKEVYNYAEFTPYVAKFTPPSSEISLLARPEGYYKSANGYTINQPPFADMFVDQRDVLKKTVKCICVRKGRPSQNYSGGTGGFLLFKWLEYETIISASFVQTVADTDITLYLNSVYGGNDEEAGIHIGDYIVMQDDDDRDVIREITDVNVDDNYVVINASFNKAFAVNSVCKIIKRGKLYDGTRTRWSDSGITYLTGNINNSTTSIPVGDSSKISQGTVIKIDEEEMLVTEVDNDNNTLTVDTRPWGDTSADTHDADATVVAYFAPGAATTSSGDKFFEIGRTNVFVRFESPDGTHNTDYTEEFIEGDYILIKCPGMKLEEQEQSKQSAYDTASIAKYKKRPYPVSNNRFMNYRKAKDAARKLVAEYKDPKYDIKCHALFLPFLNFLNENYEMTRIDIRDNNLFQYSPSFLAQTYIRDITHNPLRCETIVTLRAKEAF